MKTAWRYLLAFGLVGSLTATSCVIKTDSDGTGGSDNDTGGKGSGGSSTGGTATTGGSKATGGTSSTGGTSATGGSTSTGGSTATGGMATVVPACDGDTFKGDPATSCTFEDADLADPDIGACLKCISKAANCCDDLKNCYATDPNNQCGFGGPDGESEYVCYQGCLVSKAKAGGGAYDPDVDMDACAEACATPKCLPEPIGSITSSLIGCMHKNCEAECFVDPAM